VREEKERRNYEGERGRKRKGVEEERRGNRQLGDSDLFSSSTFSSSSSSPLSR